MIYIAVQYEWENLCKKADYKPYFETLESEDWYFCIGFKSDPRPSYMLFHEEGKFRFKWGSLGGSLNDEQYLLFNKLKEYMLEIGFIEEDF